MVKRAFRLPERLRDLWEKMEGVKKLPDFPDFRFLLYLRDFVDGKEVTENISTLQGLGIPAKVLRKKALSWQEAGVPEKKLKTLLNLFVNHPEKAGKKQYNDLTSLLQGSSMFEPASTLARHIGKARKLNYKTTIRKGPRAINMGELRQLDSRIGKTSDRFSPPLKRVLLYPFAYQISEYFGWLLERGDMETFAEAVSSLPFLFSMTAGEKAEEIRNRLLDLDPAPLLKDDPSLLNEKIDDADFEERVALLGKMKSLVRDGRQDFIELFQFLYGDMLSEIARRKENLSPRDKRELARVMETVLLRDFEFLTEDMADMVKLLVKAADAGCMERRLSILSLIVAERERNKRLRRMAEDVLNSMPALDKEDILSALHQFEYLFLPRIGALKPLIDCYEARIPFVSEVVDKILKDLKFHLLTASMSGREIGLFPMLTDIPAKKSKRKVGILRRELRAFSGHESFSPIWEYLECFPEDRFTEEGFEELLTKRHERTNSLDFLIDELHTISDRLTDDGDIFGQFFLMSTMTSIFEDQERICLRFLKKHLTGLNTTTLEKIDSLVRYLFEEDDFTGVHSDLLMRLNNLLERRIRAGEKEAEPLKEEIIDFLIKSRPKKRGRRRK